MPVTFNVAEHKAKPVYVRMGAGKRSSQDLLEKIWGSFAAPNVKCSEMIQSTFGSGNASVDDAIVPRNNGFVNTVTAAYNEHHHLVLRPDDVWIAILSQLSFYVNAHAEELRSHFVAHEGKKELTIETGGGLIDFGLIAVQFAELLDRNVVDPDLKDWIVPAFSTTTQNDKITASVLMMATLKAYFDFRVMSLCGFPSVTLEGEKADWESLLARIDKLPSFGAEPTKWVTYLRPILSRFASSFDGEPDLDFWGKVCHYDSGGSGPSYLCGWITAFCVWDADGKWIAEGTSGGATLDGVSYPVVDTDLVPAGFAEVGVNVDGSDCLMVAGNFASEIIGEKGDGIRPYPGWFIFSKREATEEEVRARGSRWY